MNIEQQIEAIKATYRVNLARKAEARIAEELALVVRSQNNLIHAAIRCLGPESPLAELPRLVHVGNHIDGWIEFTVPNHRPVRLTMAGSGCGNWNPVRWFAQDADGDWLECDLLPEALIAAEL